MLVLLRGREWRGKGGRRSLRAGGLTGLPFFWWKVLSGEWRGGSVECKCLGRRGFRGE